MIKFLIPFLFIVASCASNKTAVKAEINEQSENLVTSKKINFYLTNNSSSSIPLIIPNVMNPNLSPTSSSAVSLRVGQKVFFKYKRKKHLLLEVDNNIKTGDKIEVSTLLKNRKVELGLK